MPANLTLHPKNQGLILKVCLLLALFSQYKINGVAQDAAWPDTLRIVEMPQIEVIGYREDRLFRQVPGVVNLVRPKEIKQIQPLSGNDVFRKIPGLHIVDEEGAGLRINIGVRGLDPDRSRNVLILEDGIPVALNPYGEPEMYFTPLMDKMYGVEVLKGSGQLLFGPQTIGGVVNYLTYDPPAGQATRLKLTGGQQGFFSGHLSHGQSAGPFGYLMSYTHKRADAMGPTYFRIHDMSLKLKWQTSDRSAFGIKLGVYDETSNATYIGITQTMYDAGGQDYVRMAPDDLLPVRRYHLSLTHRFDWTSKTQLQTTAFAYTTTRNWRRQEFGYTASTLNQTGVIWGDTTVAGGAVYMRDRSSWRNRQFQVAGLESRLTHAHQTFGLDHSLRTGIRMLAERADEQFVQSNTADGFGGTMRDYEVRKGFAVSGYVVDEIRFSDRFSANVGLRVEQFDYSRNILRGRFTINGVPNVVQDTNILSDEITLAFLPGAGMTFKANDHLTLFAGVHRGFAPPRTKDAITSDGVALDIEKELSTNYELGARMTLDTWFSFNPAFFILDFQNQIIPTSQSSGNQNATGLTNGGRTRHIGVEADLEINLNHFIKSSHAYILGATVTYVHSRYAADRFIEDGETLINVRDNALPYAPSLIFNHHAGLVLDKGLGLHYYGHFVGKQYTDELNTIVPTPDGLTGVIPERYVADATVQYSPAGTTAVFSVSCKNIFDTRYIASRRPQGIKVGLPRWVTAGVEMTF